MNINNYIFIECYDINNNIINNFKNVNLEDLNINYNNSKCIKNQYKNNINRKYNCEHFNPSNITKEDEIFFKTVFINKSFSNKVYYILNYIHKYTIKCQTYAHDFNNIRKLIIKYDENNNFMLINTTEKNNILKKFYISYTENSNKIALNYKIYMEDKNNYGDFLENIINDLRKNNDNEQSFNKLKEITQYLFNGINNKDKLKEEINKPENNKYKEDFIFLFNNNILKLSSKNNTQVLINKKRKLNE